MSDQRSAISEQQSDDSRPLTADRASPFRDHRARFDAGRLGMWLFLASLAVLFAATLIGYIVIRFQLDAWPTDLPSLPGALWISTLLLAISSATMHMALLSARRDNQARLRISMAMTTILAISFLAIQSYCWYTWFNALGDHWETSQGYRWALMSFYVLTGIHAVHVIGGVAPMIIVTFRALAGRYSNTFHAGVHYCAMYWHFLGAVWIILFLTLLMGT